MVWLRNFEGARAMPRLVATGFTLVEILAALALGGVLLMLAVPGYVAWGSDLEMRDRI